MKMIEKYAYRQLLKKAAAVERRIVLPNPELVRKVCVLWQPSQEKAYKYLHDFFQPSQVIVRNICVYPQEAVAATASNVITPKDLNWLGFPRSRSTAEFMKTEYDLLLNLAAEQTLVLYYLTALSHSHFKIGRASSGLNFFDLSIRIDSSKDALYLARQQIHYLEQLNKTALV